MPRWVFPLQTDCLIQLVMTFNVLSFVISRRLNLHNRLLLFTYVSLTRQPNTTQSATWGSEPSRTQHTNVALLSIAVTVVVAVRVVVPPVALFVLIILVFVHLLLVDHQLGHLGRKEVSLAESASSSPPCPETETTGVLNRRFSRADNRVVWLEQVLSGGGLCTLTF